MVRFLTFCFAESFKWACVKENANENDFCLRLLKCSGLNGAWGVKNKTILTYLVRTMRQNKTFNQNNADHRLNFVKK
jgi:hypothetical protein